MSLRDQFNAFTLGFEHGMAQIGEWLVHYWPVTVLFLVYMTVLFLEGR